MDAVTTEHTGGGDPRRSMELLWGSQSTPRRGPRPRFTVAQIADAAVRIADADGLTALSMRRVADELHTTAMSLYTYVPGKAELVDVMLDRVYGEMDRPEGVRGGWRPRLAQVARENWRLYLRHPWLLQVATSRPVLGPNLIAKYDYELRALAGTGLTDLELDLVVQLVGDYVHGAARSAVSAAQVARASGQTDEQWWAEWAPLLERVFDADRYPTAARVGATAGAEYGAASDPDRAFEFGLDRLLDGVAALVRTHRPNRPTSSGIDRPGPRP